MQYQRGTVVRSKAGHDKGGFFVVVRAEGDMVWIADGKGRSLLHPKRKKILHLAYTTVVLDERTMSDDKKISEVLRSFQEKV